MRQIDYFKTYWLVSSQTYIKDQCCLHQKLYVWFYQSSTTEIPWDTMHAHGWSFYSSNRHLVAWLVFNSVFSPVNLHLVEICVAIQFLSMVIFTFPWKIAWMGYWKKLNKTPISSEQQSTLSLHQTYETWVFVPQGIRTYLKWLPWWLLFIKYLCEVKSVTMPTQIFHHLGFTLNSLDSREI